MCKCTEVREALQESVAELSETAWLYSREPGIDFTRKRKLDFEKLIWFLLKMGTASLDIELLEAFDFADDTPRASALVMQREKLLPEAFNSLFRDMNERFPMEKTYKGLHIAAGDGSYLPIVPDPDDPETFMQRKGPDSRPYAMIRIDAIEDVLEGRFTSLSVEPNRGIGERDSMLATLDRSFLPKRTVLVLDRGYESWNMITELMRRSQYFVIRVQDVTSAGGMLQRLELPAEGAFDITKKLVLSHSKAAETRSQPGYFYVKRDVRVDALDALHPTFEMELRIVRLEVTKGKWEVLVTNVPPEIWTAKDLKHVYHLRWGIEKSFDDLKNVIGLKSLHSKMPELILQEIFARVVMFNVDALMLDDLYEEYMGKKYQEKMNDTVATFLCRAFLDQFIDASTLKKMIHRYGFSERSGWGDHPRRPRSHAAVAFRYRGIPAA